MVARTTVTTAFEITPALASGQRGWWHREDRLLHGTGLPCVPEDYLREPFTFSSGVRTARLQARS